MAQVDLPSDSVLLAYELLHVEAALSSLVAHVTIAQDTDGSPLLSVLTESADLLLYSVDATMGTVTKRSSTVTGVEAAVTIDLCAEHVTGATHAALCCSRQVGLA